MTYYEAIEKFKEDEISYDEAKKELVRHAVALVEECPWDIEMEEKEILKRALGLLEELRFYKNYKR